MPSMSGKQALAQMLVAEGVEYIFGNPGTSETPFLDVLQDYPQLRYIQALQEGTAVGMADGYARATGRPSFANIHIAGGLANGLSALYNAHRGGTPMILTAGNSDTRMHLADPVLSGDLVQMTAQYTKWSTEILHASDVPIAVRRAFKEAKTPPTGPTYVAFSANALDDEADVDIVPSAEGHFRTAPVPPAAPDLQLLGMARQRGQVVTRNAGASLVDLGHGVLAVEFHSKLNTIGGDTVGMLTGGATEASDRFAGLVVGNDAVNFCAGANLMLVLLEAQEGNWDEIDLMVRGFQQAILGLRYSPVPVVVAPAGLTLGGGCEMVLHADRVQAAAETYMGQVEVGVGLIPAGCGTKELTVRAIDATTPGTDPLPRLQRAFETIGFGKVSTSAADARRLGLLRDVDGITMNRERLMADAKATVLDRVRDGYRAPAPRAAIPVGGEDTRAAIDLGIHLAWRGGRISDHDALIARKLARIMTGGDLPHSTTVTEQYLLDLEREAFLSLCGEARTLERIRHTLKTGKTLRN